MQANQQEPVKNKPDSFGNNLQAFLTMSPESNSHKTSYRIVKFILLLTRIIPLRMSYSLCTFVVFIGSGFPLKRMNIALGNLKIVFPEKSDRERRSIFRESLRKMLKSIFEFAYLVDEKYTANKILRMVNATGLEHLDNLKAVNRGALLYSGHFGNFPLMIIWLAAKGYPIAAIYKEAKNLPDDFFGNVMRKYNVTPLKYKSDTSLTMAVIRALKEGKIVLIQNDQSHPDGVYINFFNKYVPSPAGPALLARRVGVPIIPAYIYRTQNNHHEITILKELPLLHDDDQVKFLRRNTQIHLDWIAGVLVKHPTEWLWMHNRWKRAKAIDT
jgi:KDO2-lipid IV(A) lauroyltransferase